MPNNLRKEFLDEMWNTNVTFLFNNQKITMTMKELHDNYDIDEEEGCIVLRVADDEAEGWRYISASPYNVLNYEMVNTEFLLAYGPFRKDMFYIGRI